jgi:hypothetical protein
VYPNPVINYLIAEHPSSNRDANIQLISVAGKIIKIIPVSKNTTQTKVSIQNITTGIYQLIWTNGKESKSAKLFVK